MSLVNGVGHQAKTGVLRDSRSIHFMQEASQVDALAMNLHDRSPHLSVLTPKDTAIHGRCAGSDRLILPLDSYWHPPQVRASVIESVAVDVVNFYPVAATEAEQFTVQVDRRTTPPPTIGYATPGVDATQRPAPLIDPRGIGNVDSNVGADRPISGAQGDTNGILREHRLSPSGGVLGPGVGSNNVGASCVNYTTSLRVEAA